MKHHFLILIFIILTVYDASALDCWYAAKDNGDIMPQGNCGQLIDDDTLKLKDSHFNRLWFYEKDLAFISIGPPRKFFYISKNRKVIRTHWYDNSPDRFQEGLARTISKNKFGFINIDLDIVVAPNYDFAFPFQNGHAIVCNNCKPKPTGEHKSVVGGTWGVINNTGKVIIPIIFNRTELIKNKDFKNIFHEQKFPWFFFY